MTSHHAAADVATIEQDQPPVSSPMLALAEKAVQSGQADQLERLMDMHERWETNEARKAFDRAMAAFKADPPRIEKNAEVDFTSNKGRTHYRHATLDHVSNVISQAMAPHGLSFRWTTEQEGNQVKVTCIVAHEKGHQERVTLAGQPDNSGNKNGLQQVGSTITYLQRYTLLAATGLAASDQDDDGGDAGTPVEKISDEQLSQIEDMLEATGSDIDRFKDWAFAGIPNGRSIPLSDLRADQFPRAMEMLKHKQSQKNGASQ
ncbi:MULTISPECIES: ERF family protein [unclassified Thioalkalivibrio]|uniref:ERF family protein n=1 Tax=unclassified Thioalkalivibrio TaxID=2621013 RepID=UPI00036E21EF|nr:MULTISPECIES: ERF family protein [unclassified Thioalkalivibrio]